MEVKRLTKGRWFWKTTIFLLFGLFFTAKAQAQLGINLLPPSFSVSPLSSTVQNGDTVTLTATADCVLPAELGAITWQFSGGSRGKIPANATVKTTYNGLTAVTTTLVITNISSASLGTYTVTVQDVALNLLGIEIVIGDSSASATVKVTPTVTAVSNGSAMVKDGFKIQFSAPTGSNLVIQASTDMKHWTSVYTNTVSGGSVTYTDAVAKTVPGRFYRALLK